MCVRGFKGRGLERKQAQATWTWTTLANISRSCLSMTTRAGAANLALRAKEDIVRLLHGYQHHHSSFSFEELRIAFLKRAHQIHPDKVKSKKDYHPKEFIELKESWDRYEKTSKVPTGIRSPEAGAGSFTMFGVGCSFSDNESERLERNKIMDEASRGWFSAGEIPSADDKGPGSKIVQPSPLTSDDLFESAPSYKTDAKEGDKVGASKPSLISHLYTKPKR